MYKPPRIPIIACALLFWLSAILRVASADYLHRLFDRALAAARLANDRHAPPAAARRQVEVAALNLPPPPDGGGLRLVAQARLNGRVILQLAPQPSGDRLLLPLPLHARGLLQVSVAVLNGATCMIAAASESRWFDSDRYPATADTLSLALSLRPLPKPLCT
ncbi:MAG TPA: hypothetical protein PKI03_29035 [Pseudomonadota bacterium]|nr:hypothetical protein [Pseudomonadota bacterium]